MLRILFICHGNICRSPMAEYVFKHLAEEQSVLQQFDVASAAVSNEETGNDIYPPAKRKLLEKGIPFRHHAAHTISRSEYAYYDYIICADKSNIRRLERLFGADSIDSAIKKGKHMPKVSLMMQWAGEERDVADPWYTGDFEEAFEDIQKACKAILQACI